MPGGKQVEPTRLAGRHLAIGVRVMPDALGYEVFASWSPSRSMVYHHPCGTYVRNTPQAKAAHTRVCRKEQQRIADAVARVRQQEATARLRRINAEKRLLREVTR